jgi:hypothetical protein
MRTLKDVLDEASLNSEIDFLLNEAIALEKMIDEAPYNPISNTGINYQKSGLQAAGVPVNVNQTQPVQQKQNNNATTIEGLKKEIETDISKAGVPVKGNWLDILAKKITNFIEFIYNLYKNSRPIEKIKEVVNKWIDYFQKLAQVPKIGFVLPKELVK